MDYTCLFCGFVSELNGFTAVSIGGAVQLQVDIHSLINFCVTVWWRAEHYGILVVNIQFRELPIVIPNLIVLIIQLKKFYLDVF